MSAVPAHCCRAHAAAAEEGEGAAPATRRTRLQSVARVFRQVFGIPDFERYREHMRERHPGAPLLSAREFHAMAIDRRYGAARPRCC
jgi:uncharacterized short protein YbdD (DUF466 family)